MEEVNCTYCQNPIDSVRIRCVECPQFDLCLQCCSCGVEAGSHKKEHDYQVLDHGAFPLFDQRQLTWNSAQELQLLEAVEQFGFGNWKDISEKVEEKSAEECQEHYFMFYIHGLVGQSTLLTEFTKKVRDHTTQDGGPLSPSLTTPLPPVDISVQEQHALGYMPLRDDFEREYDNDAETIISGLDISLHDDDLDNAFKLAQVDMYRHRLKERQRRKQIAREHNVISVASAPATKIKTPVGKTKQSKDEKDYQDKMRVFAQFHTAKEHEQLFENLQKEKQTKIKIKEIFRYRRNGITKLEDSGEFDRERYRREKRKDTKKKLGNSFMGKRTSTKDGKDERVDLSNKADVEMQENNREIFTMPSLDLLTSQEKKLCKTIGLKPASYVTIKTCIIKDYLQRRHGLQTKIRYPSHMDKTHRRKILSFLSDNGWIGGV